MKDENMKGKMKNILLIVLILIVVVLIILFVTGIISFNKVVNNNSNGKENNIILSETDAIEIGEELYDKVTEIYSVWVLRPYCGYDVNSDTTNLKKETFGNSGNGNSLYYESQFTSLDELKNYLSEYLSDKIINDNVKEIYQLNGETYYKYVTDISLLSSSDPHYSYVDYVLKDNKLYCRLEVGKGWLNNKYLNEYSLKVSDITEDKVVFTVTSTYINDETLNSESTCNFENPNNCSESDKEYKDTEFVIEKVDNNWIVTSYILHE